MRVLQDFKSTHPDPWYSIAKLPVLGAGWDIRSPTQSILTIGGIPVKLFTVGPVTATCFYAGVAASDTTRSHISIKLTRPQDRAALGGMHSRGRSAGRERAIQPVECFTAIAVHNANEVRTRRDLLREEWLTP